MASIHFAASSLGLLTGLLIGLSTSPVVASVVSALLAMAAGIMALTGVKNPFLAKGEEAQGRKASHDWAVMAFAVMAIAGLGGGLWARTHDALSPAPQELAAKWIDAGLDADVAARLAAFRLTGAMINAGGEIAEAQADSGKAATSTVLFAHTSKSGCQRTNPSRMKDANEARNAWRLAPAPWPRLADALRETPIDTLASVWTSLCAGDQ